MAHQIPSEIPSKFIAGDTIKWDIDLSDYPASEGWTLTYEPRGNQPIATITATNTGDTYNIVIPAATSAEYAVGIYYYQAYVTMDIDAVENRHTAGSGFFEVATDLQTAPGSYDGRSTWKEALDNLEQLIKTYSGRGKIQMQIAGQMVTMRSYDEMQKLHGFLFSKYQAELDEQNRQNGKKSSNVTRTRFI